MLAQFSITCVRVRQVHPDQMSTRRPRNGVPTRSRSPHTWVILEKMEARSDTQNARQADNEEPTSDTPFLLALSTLAVGMLALLAVLVLAGDRGLGGVLPLLAVPLLLILASGVILWYWGAAEAAAGEARDVAERAPTRPQPRQRRKAP